MTNIRNIDITFNDNILSFAGIIFILYWMASITLFLFSKPVVENPKRVPALVVTIVKGVILLLGCTIVFLFLQKKTAVNFFYITGMFFFLIYILGELLIEFAIYVIIPVLSSIPGLKALSSYLFYDGEVNRRQMKILFILIAYSLVIIGLLQQILTDHG